VNTIQFLALTILRLETLEMIFNNLVLTLKKHKLFSYYRERARIAVYCENNTKQMNVLYGISYVKNGGLGQWY
jgi:hypothetical protein